MSSKICRPLPQVLSVFSARWEADWPYELAAQAWGFLHPGLLQDLVPRSPPQRRAFRSTELQLSLPIRRRADSSLEICVLISICATSTDTVLGVALFPPLVLPPAGGPGTPSTLHPFPPGRPATGGTCRARRICPAECWRQTGPSCFLRSVACFLWSVSCVLRNQSWPFSGIGSQRRYSVRGIPKYSRSRKTISWGSKAENLE